MEVKLQLIGKPIGPQNKWKFEIMSIFAKIGATQLFSDSQQKLFF